MDLYLVMDMGIVDGYEKQLINHELEINCDSARGGSYPTGDRHHCEKRVLVVWKEGRFSPVRLFA